MFDFSNESMNNLFDAINTKLHRAGYSYSSAVSVTDAAGMVITGHTNGAIWTYVNPDTQYKFVVNTQEGIYTKSFLHGALKPVTAHLSELSKDKNI